MFPEALFYGCLSNAKAQQIFKSVFTEKFLKKQFGVFEGSLRASKSMFFNAVHVALDSLWLCPASRVSTSNTKLHFSFHSCYKLHLALSHKCAHFL